MIFKDFKRDVEKAFKNMMKADSLYEVIIDNDLLWTTYLLSFEDEIERQEHNCNACKSFIRHYGKVVAIDPQTYEIKTFWDNVHTSGYEKTAAALAKTVKESSICNLFVQSSNESYGCDHNIQLLPNRTTKTWNHLYIVIPNKFRVNNSNSAATYRGDARARKEVLQRSITELTDEAIDTVIDLIENNSLYRGAEFLKVLQDFRRLKSSAPIDNLSNFCWFNFKSSVAKIRNTAIGTLLIDLSKGEDLEKAVKAYEVIMAPANYKRPTALITKKQIEQAQKTVEELGLTNALPRRHAHVEDISVNDVLFVNRDTRSHMKDGGLFDALTEASTVNVKAYSNKATVTTLDNFISNVLPNSKDVQILVENKHIPNFVTLTAPENPDAGQLFKWKNNFAWVYNGSLADSFKEKVKKAGGNVEGFMRCSLHWFNYDDLDIHVTEPSGNEIYYGSKRGKTGGVLDVDMNAGSGRSRDAVENIIWKDNTNLSNGVYALRVHNFCRRESVDVGFEIEIEVNGELHQFHYTKMVINNGYVAVANIIVKNGNITIKPYIEEGSTSTKSIKEWNIDTMQFQTVSCIMYSPNHWEGNEVGNKHVFFMIKDCKNPDPVRGFFNEYLRSDLESKHRRVFEALGSKAKVEYSDNQLSGLGFSTTQRNNVIVKVDNKPFKIEF